MPNPPFDAVIGPLYNRQGVRIDFEEWARLNHGEPDYRRVAEEQIGLYWISTVWIGIDLSLGRNPTPLIFESMVFATVDSEPGWDSPVTESLGHVLEGRRYATEEEARLGHSEILTVLRATTETDPDSLLADRVE